MDNRLKKWIRWLDIIQKQIYQLVIYRDLFWTVQGLIKNNKDIQKPSIFYRFLSDSYVSCILMGIRRQAKISQQSISFARLLDEIANDSAKISRKYYKSLYKGSVIEELADKDFDQFCGTDPNHISSKMVNDDLKKLKKTFLTCEGFADKRIAHWDKSKPKKMPKFKDVDNCIDKLDQLYCKYHLILHAESCESLRPTYEYDWQEIFDKPWRDNM